MHTAFIKPLLKVYNKLGWYSCKFQLDSWVFCTDGYFDISAFKKLLTVKHLTAKFYHEGFCQCPGMWGR